MIMKNRVENFTLWFAIIILNSSVFHLNNWQWWVVTIGASIGLPWVSKLDKN